MYLDVRVAQNGLNMRFRKETHALKNVNILYSLTCIIKGIKENAQSFHTDMKQTAGDPRKIREWCSFYNVKKRLKIKERGPEITIIAVAE